MGLAKNKLFNKYFDKQQKNVEKINAKEKYR